MDTIFYGGEAEVDLPELVRKALNGEQLPRDMKGRDPKVEQIPTIVKPARFGGEVQVTRGGCPQGGVPVLLHHARDFQDNTPPGICDEGGRAEPEARL